MTKKQIDTEFKKIILLTHKDKSLIEGYYPLVVVRKRELLLYAQVYLAKILEAKREKKYKYESFYVELYNTIIKHYYNYNYQNGNTY